MTLTLIPDAELVVHTYLAAHPDVRALTTNIVGQPPQARTGAWVQVRQLDSSKEARSTPEHLMSYLVQLDCYASKAGVSGSQQREASLLARTVRAALVDMPAHAHVGAVVSKVLIVGMPRLPDSALEPARERYVITADIYMHAA